MKTPGRQNRPPAANLGATRARTRRRRRPTPANACPSGVPHRSRGTGLREIARRPVPRALWTTGNGKRERGTWTIVRFRPETAMMSLDDGAADREPDTHAVAFRGVEGVKQLVHAPGIDAHADIPHAHTHTIAVLPFASDQQLPRAIVDTHHRVGGVAEQVQDDL